LRTVDPEKHEHKRQLILTAAERCFLLKGFRGASISDICAAAGISPGHLYHYFSSKEAIVDAMVERGLGEAGTRFASIAANPDIVGAFLSEFGRNKGRGRRSRIALSIEILAEAARNPAMAKVLRRHYAHLRELMTGFFLEVQKRGQIDSQIDAELAADIFICAMDGIRCLAVREPSQNLARGTNILKAVLTRLLAPQAR
jgi:TetR/AcrR family transcriptional regulator, repressor for uid operon